jgi:hypothetical protein
MRFTSFGETELRSGYVCGITRVRFGPWNGRQTRFYSGQWRGPSSCNGSTNSLSKSVKQWKYSLLFQVWRFVNRIIVSCSSQAVCCWVIKKPELELVHLRAPQKMYSTRDISIGWANDFLSTSVVTPQNLFNLLIKRDDKEHSWTQSLLCFETQRFGHTMSEVRMCRSA